jgi:solute carrier family 39 (zinc transporter), member 1/2/3
LNRSFALSYRSPASAQNNESILTVRSKVNITLLEGGILFHSVFVGMTVSITIDGFVVLLIAILFHQMFEGLGLGSRIAAVPYPKGSGEYKINLLVLHTLASSLSFAYNPVHSTVRPWLLVLAFGTTAPIGQAIGLATRSSYDPNSAFGLIIVGVFNAMQVSQNSKPYLRSGYCC